jgi:hypothetical protein
MLFFYYTFKSVLMSNIMVNGGAIKSAWFFIISYAALASQYSFH